MWSVSATQSLEDSTHEPNFNSDGDIGASEELLDLIEAKGRAVVEALAALRAIGAGA
jgi:hypothetical protein